MAHVANSTVWMNGHGPLCRQSLQPARLPGHGDRTLSRQSHVVVSYGVRAPSAITSLSPNRRYRRLPPSPTSDDDRQPGQPQLQRSDLKNGMDAGGKKFRSLSKTLG